MIWNRLCTWLSWEVATNHNVCRWDKRGGCVKNGLQPCESLLFTLGSCSMSYHRPETPTSSNLLWVIPTASCGGNISHGHPPVMTSPEGPPETSYINTQSQSPTLQVREPAAGFEILLWFSDIIKSLRSGSFISQHSKLSLHWGQLAGNGSP